MQADRGFAFVKLDTHEHAAMAIVQLQGQMVHGRSIKCSWGKDRADGAAPTPISPTAGAAPYGNMPMYGMPQPNTFGQYAYGGYGGFPNQAAGTPGAGGAGGMPQPTGAGAGLGLAPGGQAPGADAGGQAGQAQWAADPSSYYSNYWGGYYGQQAGQQPDSQMAAP